MFKVQVREICSHGISLIWNTAAGLMNTSWALALHTTHIQLLCQYKPTGPIKEKEKKAGKCKVKTEVLDVVWNYWIDGKSWKDSAQVWEDQSVGSSFR